jgi:hypothetical protein
MAIGRISGPMLYNNLERQGVDLAIEGNIVYVDVTNRRLGANTTTPNADLQVVGTANLANISITGNTISSDLGKVNLGTPANITVTGGGADYVLVTDGVGNLRWDEISNLDQTWGNLLFSNNKIGITNIDGNLELESNGSGSVVALNNFHAPNLIGGNVNAVYVNANLRGETVVTTGNVTAPYFVGNVRGTNIIMDANIASSWYLGNVDATYVNTTGNVNAPYFEGNVQAPLITATGNVTAPYFVGNVRATDINTTGNIDAPNFNGNINGTTAVMTGNVTAAYFIGNITSESSTVSGNVSANLLIGNISTQQVTSPTGDLHLSAATNDPNNIIRFDSVSAFDIPSGTTAQRPPSPDYGYVRYNTESGTIEWWGGTSWVSGAQTIQTETITPDGASLTYTLNQSTTETGILVNVNGTIQQAGSGAYTVAGDQITFGEAPLATDIIEIRYLASGVAALTTNFANIASNVVPSSNVTYSLGSTTNRWKDLWLSGSTIYLGDATLSSSNGAIQLPAGSTVGGATVNVASINSNISTVNANVTAANAAIITANTGMKNYVDQGLAAALFAASSYGNAVVQAYLPLDPTITTMQANAGAYQTYANANIGILYLDNISTQANLGAYQTYANADVAATQANLGAYQTYANANASTQATSLTAIDANIGAFYTYANAKIGTNTNSNLLITAGTTSTSNVTGALVLRGGVGISGNLNANGVVKLGQLGTASNVVIGGTTAASSTTTGALVVRGGIGVAGGVYAGSVVATTVSGSSVSTYNAILNNTGVTVQAFVGREVQDSTITTTDVDLSGYFPVSSTNYCYVTIQVTGQYIANIEAPATQARLLKSWSAGVFKVDATGFFTVEGEVLQHAVFNTDGTNFPAGAVSAGKAFLTGSGTSTVALRFTNRTTPAATSATYWSYKVEVQTV